MAGRMEPRSMEADEREQLSSGSPACGAELSPDVVTDMPEVSIGVGHSHEPSTDRSPAGTAGHGEEDKQSLDSPATDDFSLNCSLPDWPDLAISQPTPDQPTPSTCCSGRAKRGQHSSHSRSSGSSGSSSGSSGNRDGSSSSSGPEGGIDTGSFWKMPL